MTDLLMGVDVGTTSTKSAVFDTNGVLMAEAACATPLVWQGEGNCHQDPDDLWRAAVSSMRACSQQVADRGDVCAIAIAGQMAGVMGIDGEWNPSTPYDSWLDRRCAPDVEFLRQEVGNELVRLTGCPPMVNHGPKMRWWRRENSAAFGRTKKFVMPATYVAGRMAGLRADDAFIDRTYLHFSAASDARRAEWSTALLCALGVPLEKMPDIVSPSAVIGSLTVESALASGLKSGTPIAAGLGDTAAAALGAGIVQPGQALDIAGTAAVFAVANSDFRPDLAEATLIVMSGALPGQWISLAYLSGGDLLAWFEAALSPQQLQDHQEHGKDFTRLTEGVEEVAPGARGLVFIPHLDGRILPSATSMRGAWVGLTRQHRREDFLRAILESVGYEYAGYLETVEALHAPMRVSEIRVVGGGARSAVWNQIKSSVLARPYSRLQREEPGCWGAALVAGQAVGLFSDLAATADRTSRIDRVYQPERTAHRVYQQMLRHYRSATSSLLCTFDQLDADTLVHAETGS